MASPSIPRGATTEVTAGLGRGPREQLEPQRLAPRAGGPRQAVVAQEHAVEPLALQHAQHLAQADDEADRGGEVRLVAPRELPLGGEVEVVLRQVRRGRPRPGSRGERAEAEPGRQHQPLLRAGHHHVDAPRVHLEGRDAEARDGVDDQEGVGLPGHRRVGAHVVQHAGRGLAVLGQHGPDLGMGLQSLRHALRGHGVTEGRGQLDRRGVRRPGRSPSSARRTSPPAPPPPRRRPRACWPPPLPWRRSPSRRG